MIHGTAPEPGQRSEWVRTSLRPICLWCGLRCVPGPLGRSGLMPVNTDLDQGAILDQDHHWPGSGDRRLRGGDRRQIVTSGDNINIVWLLDTENRSIQEKEERSISFHKAEERLRGLVDTGDNDECKYLFSLFLSLSRSLNWIPCVCHLDPLYLLSFLPDE